MTVSELLGKCSSYELSEWMVYFQLRAEEDEARRKELEVGA